MAFQNKYSTPTSLALLQTFLAMMDHVQMTYDYFNELTGLSKSIYKEVLHLLKNMIRDLNMQVYMMRLDDEIITEKTRYKVYSYVFIHIDDYRFEIPDDLAEERLITYSAVILYLKLKFGQYVSYPIMARILPNLTRRKFNYLIKSLQSVIGEGLAKNRLQSYELIRD